MEISTFEKLLTPGGQRALADAVELDPTLAKFPACVDRLAKSFPRDLARAAVETVLLRQKASGKFARASEMYFTREALEMATSEPVASHRSGRFASFPVVADLCCGIGADAIGIASSGRQVLGADRDPLLARMAEANLAVHGGRGSFLVGDILTEIFPKFEAAFADPGRRPSGKRTIALDDSEPPVPAIVARLGADFPLGVKVAPGVPREDLRRFDAEAEFVALAGELKECVLWFGPLRSAAVRATVLPGNHTLTGVPGGAEIGPVGSVVYDPSPAVTRAGLVGVLAESLESWQFEAEVAFLTSETVDPIPTPFASAYRVEDVLPFHARRLAEYLRERRVGRVTIVKRGSPVDAEELTAKLKLRGDSHRELLLTRSQGQPIVIVGRRI